MNIPCIRVLSNLLCCSHQFYHNHPFLIQELYRLLIRKIQDCHLSYGNQHLTDYKYKYKFALNCLVLCALFCRSQTWLLHCHPVFPVNTAQVAYLSTHLISKVCRLDHITKQTNLNNSGQQLEFHKKLIVYQQREL
jgi:hypothetical protein